MSYAYDVLKWIEAKKIKSFTHKDIQNVTLANSSHAVLRDMIKIIRNTGKDIKIVEMWETTSKKVKDAVTKEEIELKKRYKRYFIEKGA